MTPDTTHTDDGIPDAVDVPDAEYAIPADADPVACDYCGTQFPTERARALHEGRRHSAVLDGDRRERYEAAEAEERDDLRLFRFKSLAGLVLVYFGFLLTYALATADQIGF